VDGLDELNDLVGEVAPRFCCSSCWTVCHWWSATTLAPPVRKVYADHHEGRQEYGFERHNHGEQSERVGLDPEADPGGKPDDVDIDGLGREGAERVSAGCYGSIVAASTLAGSAAVPPGELALLVVATNLVYFSTHVFSLLHRRPQRRR
jgi:hypothetical protein